MERKLEKSRELKELKETDELKEIKETKDRKEIKEMFEKLEPSLKQKEDMWKKINKKRQEKKEHRFFPAAAGAGILLLVAVMGFYIASSENIIQAMRNLFKIEQRQENQVKQDKVGKDQIEKDKKEEVCEEIIQGVKNVYRHEEMYAPRLVLCSDKLAIFANTAGMIVYHREEKQVIMTVDLQKIGCSYIERGGYVITGFLPKDHFLYIFNEVEGKLKNTYYTLDLFDISKLEKNSFREYAKKERKEKKKQFYKEWKAYEKSHYFEDLLEKKKLKAGNAYSGFDFCWEDQGNKKISSLCIDKKERYFLITEDKKSKKIEKEELCLLTKEQEEKILPKFQYGENKDKVLEAICNYFCENAEERKREEKALGIYKEEVYIPAPIIFKKIKKKDVIIVFLEMTYGYYYKNGIILEKTSGGSFGVRIKLKKIKNGYQVKECLFAKDGAGNRDSIESFTKGYPEITKKYFDYNMLEKERAKVEKKMYQIYLKENKVDKENEIGETDKANENDETNEVNVIYYRGKGGILKEIDKFKN